jgi:hypothetical protein
MERRNEVIKILKLFIQDSWVILTIIATEKEVFLLIPALNLVLKV